MRLDVSRWVWLVLDVTGATASPDRGSRRAPRLTLRHRGNQPDAGRLGRRIGVAQERT